MSRLERFQERLGYVFVDDDLLLRAVTHSSYAHEHDVPHNQTLEFLGDAVVDLVASQVLLAAHPEAREGELSRRRSAMVNEGSLAKIARQIGVPDVLRLGRSERRSQISDRPLADAVEALVGAVFLEAGYAAAEQVVRPWFTQLGEDIARGDPKSRLQEYTQKRHNELPEYVVVSESGPPHDRTYEIAVRVREREVGRGSGRTKKEAEQQAALKAIEELEEHA